MKATAVARPIQGLIKYHGLKKPKQRIPYHDSISVCVQALHARRGLVWLGHISTNSRCTCCNYKLKLTWTRTLVFLLEAHKSKVQSISLAISSMWAIIKFLMYSGTVVSLDSATLAKTS